MAYQWTKERIRWYLNASARSSFHHQLAEELLPFLNPSDRVVDFGCGLGRLDLELATHVAHITCVDRDPHVLHQLQEDAAARGYDNLITRCLDAGDMQDPFDTAVLCFFGTPPSLMLQCAKQAKRRLIRVMNADPSPSHLVGGRRRETAEEVAAALERAGLPYRLFFRHLSFDQPLASREDAEHFLQAHHPELSSRQIQDILSSALTATADATFPLRLPKEKRLGIFVVETQG